MKKIIVILLGIILLYAAASFFYNKYFSRVLLAYPQKIATNCHNQIMNPNQKTIRVLVIDGGGINGLRPLMILKYLEQRTGLPTADLFDLISGNSSGSIIASVLNTPNEFGKPKYSAEKLFFMFADFSKKVLEPSIARKVMNIDGLIGPRLSLDVLHQNLLNLFGKQLTFNALLKNEIISVYDIEKNRSYVLKNWLCDDLISRYLVADLTSAASAAPGFFAPVVLHDIKHNRTHALVDGMLFANNPSLVAMREAHIMYPNAEKIILVHLDTGGDGSLESLKLDVRKMQSWGLMRKAKALIRIFLASQTSVVEDTLDIMQKFGELRRFKLYNFKKNLDNPAPFDASDQNIDKIIKTGDTLINEQKNTLDTLADELKKIN